MEMRLLPTQRGRPEQGGLYKSVRVRIRVRIRIRIRIRVKVRLELGLGSRLG
jgi:hypothetical protein